MSNNLNIFFVGEVSAGKSTLINAIAGGIISNTSLQRETMTPESYSFVKETNMKAYPSFKQMASILEQKHINNKNIKNKLESSNNKKPSITIPTGIVKNKITFKSLFAIGDFIIYDFPGLNDSHDKDNQFFEIISENIMLCDLLVYVTDSKSAFIKQSEVDLFKRLIELCEIKRIEEGKYIKLCIVINKFDDQYNSDLITISNEISKKIKDIDIFRISGHKLLVENIVKHKLSIPIPKFYYQEIRDIFKNSNVIITKEQVESLQTKGKIKHKFIEFNQDIDIDIFNEGSKLSTKKTNINNDINIDSDDGSDFEDEHIITENNKIKYKNKYNGDWNNFIDLIKKENENIDINKAKYRNIWLDKCFEMFRKLDSNCVLYHVRNKGKFIENDNNSDSNDSDSFYVSNEEQQKETELTKMEDRKIKDEIRKLRKEDPGLSNVSAMKLAKKNLRKKIKKQTIKEEYQMFVKLSKNMVDIYDNYLMYGNIIEKTIKLIKNIFMDEFLVCTFVRFLFDEEELPELPINFKEEICNIIFEEVNIINNKNLLYHHVYLICISLEVSISGLLKSNCNYMKLLSSHLLWDSKKKIHFFKFTDTNTIFKVSNNLVINPYYKTKCVEIIRNNCDNFIALIIEFALATKNDLKLLHSNNGIPYEKIEKYIGRQSMLRLKINIIEDINYGNSMDKDDNFEDGDDDAGIGVVPLLFNTEPNEKINKRVLEYMEFESKINKLQNN